MTTAAVSSSAKRSKQKRARKGGKRPLYDPNLGASNYRKAEGGRFAYHPTFLASQNLAGASIGLERLLSGGRQNKQRLIVIARQLGKALCDISDETKNLRSPSDKIRFAEAMAAFFNPPKGPDEDVRCVAWRAIQMRTELHQEPSQAELRRAVKQKDHKQFSDEQWKRLMKKTGLNKELPTHLKKTQGIKLRKV